ncbi:hypothetical protein K2173_002504 [Erythroxylum novogranatense]|uniref:Uncharacterized protein n=1 Tax=Erythroxylum novogranatense TaxID=1862640 RepID=A0AAV8TQS2_9ROSI|nr:hypothetical protein K2173_002504 [Erythroxylum novogranatense]
MTSLTLSTKGHTGKGIIPSESKRFFRHKRESSSIDMNQYHVKKCGDTSLTNGVRCF